MFLFHLLSAIVIVPIIAAVSQKEYPFLKTQINDEKHAVAFNKLLNSIVKVNQKRLDAIKRLNKLQATDVYPTLEDTLRSDTTRRDSDESDSDTSNENIIYLVIPEPPVPNASQDHSPPSVPSNGQNTSNPNLDLQRQRKPDLQQNGPEQIRAHDYTRLRGPNETTHMSLSKDGLEALRQNIERSCKSKEVKKCKRACVAAAKSACEVYDCRKKLKKKFKKECKRECKAEFKSSW